MWADRSDYTPVAAGTQRLCMAATETSRPKPYVTHARGNCQVIIRDRPEIR
jgi:hypothetical protein